jgi:hypothetical protein
MMTAFVKNVPTTVTNAGTRDLVSHVPVTELLQTLVSAPKVIMTMVLPKIAHHVDTDVLLVKILNYTVLLVSSQE